MSVMTLSTPRGWCSRRRGSEVTHEQQIDALGQELDGLDRRDLWEMIFDLRALLTDAFGFISEEADNRSAAGSEMTDYESEPRELAGRIREALK